MDRVVLTGSYFCTDRWSFTIVMDEAPRHYEDAKSGAAAGHAFGEVGQMHGPVAVEGSGPPPGGGGRSGTIRRVMSQEVVGQ
jgi:hypothetical protein